MEEGEKLDGLSGGGAASAGDAADAVAASEEPAGASSLGAAVSAGLRETLDTFRAFIKSPAEIIGLNIINIIEGMAYFGTLTYLVIYMHENVGLSDPMSTLMVSLFTMFITIAQLLLGGISDRMGSIRALGVSLIVLTLGRIVIGHAEFMGIPGGGAEPMLSPLFITVTSALVFCALAYGLYQPAIYSATRQYSDKKTSAVSFAMLYAGMNLGAFIIGLALPYVRRFSADRMGNNGLPGSLMFLSYIMIAALAVFLVIVAMRRRRGAGPVGEEDAEASTDKDGDGGDTGHEKKPLTLLERLRRHPLADAKFDFFIFILIPVQTLFAYQNILIPTYLSRCFKDYPTISDNFEAFSNINPLIVFVAAPVIAALTAKSNVYKMMIIGTAVMSVPTFLLVLGANPLTFMAFVLIMSIGESMWQPRFLQYAAEIAPKDRVGAYMGIAQLPWFLTKFVVGMYSGFFMQKYMPESGAMNSEMMWFIFAGIAVISPIALFAARRWMNPQKAS